MAEGIRPMVILIFSLCFVIVLFLTGSHKYFDKYRSTALFVSTISLLYVLLCRNYMLWNFNQWWFVTSKVSTLLQFVPLFPSTVVLFLRYLPVNRLKILYFLGFVGIYVLMEACLKIRGEIVYLHGWTFGWSVFLNFCVFALAWIHARNWKAGWTVSTCITVFLMVWFRVPLHG